MKKIVRKVAVCFIVQRRGVSSPSSMRKYSSLEKRLDCDTHKYALEYETLYDKAMIMYAAKLEHGAGVVPETVDEEVIILLKDEGPALPMGWALKSATVTRKNLTATQKTYLTSLKCSKKENAPGKSLILLTFQRQCEEPSTAMATVSFKGSTPSYLRK